MEICSIDMDSGTVDWFEPLVGEEDHGETTNMGTRDEVYSPVLWYALRCLFPAVILLPPLSLTFLASLIPFLSVSLFCLPSLSLSPYSFTSLDADHRIWTSI